VHKRLIPATFCPIIVSDSWSFFINNEILLET